ncbi:ETC complex I subunit [Trema orientale]|uniref:ETC complex I subunit n=1 Tax=Trema orientale TaxID=63057 RepID=A0A2P5FLY5_TREOI|nr:ETC complex I subunit [Trema orientale]
MAHVIKQTTRIVADSLHPHVATMARRYLLILYNRMVERARLLPSDEIYRGNLEDHAHDRLKIFREEVDLWMIEKRVDCGGVHDLILQAHAELHQLDLLLNDDGQSATDSDMNNPKGTQGVLPGEEEEIEREREREREERIDPLMAQVKQTTRIAADSLHPHVAMMVRRYLLILYNRLRERARSVPTQESPRGRPENLARRGLRICREEVDLSMIEKRIGCGGVQDLIHQARAELYQIDLFFKEAPWKQ